MQLVCPICGKIGLLQTITPRYYRVRYSTVTGNYGTLTGRAYNKRTFTYHRVSTDWALEQISAEKQREEEAYRRIMGIN